ncbi:Phosphate ABC transporter, periplasmic phosphate-binding protein PstS (TC 3.A.1.7.1) [hydrothermal vent metagenome]|uniref:Phosphate ABC transporter, periplasmic phosphate-binding protein PstS (TC 3.A.1.7.1) n=1 Tax=hydrothermal vent metagenome TaxID=652676 RepID=A0A3B1B898_9ZZZZ
MVTKHLLYIMHTYFRSMLFLLFLSSLSVAQGDEKDTQRENPIVGGGAHFSWVIFHELKPDLERLLNRDIELYGKDSALGLGCNAGIKNAIQNTKDHETFGFVCCELTEKEINDKQLHVHPLAYEPILILLNKSNPIESLSTEQVRNIFRGKIHNWSEVGGEDKPIVVVTRLHCKGRPGHWKRILPEAKLFRKDRLNVTAADDMVRKISDFSGAIGHTGATWVFESKDKIKPIKVDGYAPTAKNLKAKTYPFYRTLSAITIKSTSSDVIKLIEEVQHGRAFNKVAKKYELLPYEKK